MKALPLCITAAAIFASGYLELPAAFGAHPWWAGQVVWIGAPIGLIIAFAMSRFPAQWQLLGLLGLMLIGSLAALQGKAIFAASYAENAFAGQAWYFGWIATSAGVSGLLFAALRRILSQKSQS